MTTPTHKLGVAHLSHIFLTVKQVAFNTHFKQVYCVIHLHFKLNSRPAICQSPTQNTHNITLRPPHYRGTGLASSEVGLKISRQRTRPMPLERHIDLPYNSSAHR